VVASHHWGFRQADEPKHVDLRFLS